jgi:hypothetical protein
MSALTFGGLGAFRKWCKQTLWLETDFGSGRAAGFGPGLAAVWILIFIVNLSQRDGSNMMAEIRRRRRK